MSFFIDHSSDCIGLLYMRAVYSLMYESQQRRSSFMNCILQWSHRILIPDELDIFKASERFVAETSKRPHFCLRIVSCIVIHVYVDCIHDEIDVCTRHILHAATGTYHTCCH